MSGYVSYEDNSRVIIRADSSAGRRSRGAQVAAAKRAWEKANGSAQGKLTRYLVTYWQFGLLARTEVAYYTSYGMNHRACISR